MFDLGLSILDCFERRSGISGGSGRDELEERVEDGVSGGVSMIDGSGL